MWRREAVRHDGGIGSLRRAVGGGRGEVGPSGRGGRRGGVEGVEGGGRKEGEVGVGVVVGVGVSRSVDLVWGLEVRGSLWSAMGRKDLGRWIVMG